MRNPEGSRPSDSDDKKLRSEFRERLIKEFRSALASSEYEIPTKTEGIIILSGEEFVQREEQVDWSLPGNLENRARIELGLEVARQVVARKTSKSVEEIADEEIMQDAPLLILSGTTKQLPIMQRVAEELGFPQQKIRQVNCEIDDESNTKTQLETINQYCADKEIQNHITLVTSGYHAPRVARTGQATLNPGIEFDFVPVPHEKFPQYNVFKVVYGEVKKIVSYAKKGDISRDLRDK